MELMRQRNSAFRIFDPNATPEEQTQARNSSRYRLMMSRKGQPNTPFGEPQSQSQPQPTNHNQSESCHQSAALPLSSKIEALLDLHQQQLEAIQAATELIARTLGFNPDDHT